MHLLNLQILRCSKSVQLVTGRLLANLVCIVQKPDEAGVSGVVAPVGAAMQAANTLADNRRSRIFNHNKVVAEGLQSLSWVLYTGPNSGEIMPPRLSITQQLDQYQLLPSIGKRIHKSNPCLETTKETF